LHKQVLTTVRLKEIALSAVANITPFLVVPNKSFKKEKGNHKFQISNKLQGTNFNSTTMLFWFLVLNQ